MENKRLLAGIKSAEDLRALPEEELESLCREIRDVIIQTVAANGGHLASNLGVVELTVALDRVFDLSKDKIVWDVGHQTYAHKLLTGRYEQFGTLRQKGGISGFPNRRESVYDPLTSGHSSTSISAAYGLACAERLKKSDGHTVAVIGDGALSGGLAYEGLNNAGRSKRNFIVILNDNDMSISKNVGSMSRHLTSIRTKPNYLRVKSGIERGLEHIPLVGVPVAGWIRGVKNKIKKLIYRGNMFDDLGFSYYGPIDGHDLPGLLQVLQSVKEMDRPVLVHVVTQKGRGYTPAEDNPGAYHGVSPFDPDKGVKESVSSSFSDVFSDSICELAARDPAVCGITAAMDIGTGLDKFRRSYPDRFFDVGIAEGHAVTFAGGLAANGMKPVFAVYSTFLQRAYDQILHDAALQQVNITLAVDRAGIVGNDGETHQGVFDVSFLRTVPGVQIYSPAYYAECREMLRCSVDEPCVSVVRYPRGKEGFRPDGFESSGSPWQLFGESSERILVTYGRTFSAAAEARKVLRDSGINVQILKLNRIQPIDPAAVKVCLQAREVYFAEESVAEGSVGEHFAALLMKNDFNGRFVHRAVPNMFIPHAQPDAILHGFGLDAAGLEQMILTGKGEYHGTEEETGCPAL
ncbi:MAG: 1-deoxy-D-xylulose-5-phosphate synthase [Clostridia bacterium]|nr:1-deoxy-D-xylulose-5-phosphate synthase [Clostridia bacterium]